MSGRSRRRVAAAATAPGLAVGPAAQAPRKERAAAISILSNTLVIALKVVAGIVTGSIAILTEAAHSAIDLVASVIAFLRLICFHLLWPAMAELLGEREMLRVADEAVRHPET